MKFEFTDTVTGDIWFEYYPSLSKVPPEDLEGCTYKIIEEEDSKTTKEAL